MGNSLLKFSVVGFVVACLADPVGAAQSGKLTRDQAAKTALTKAPGGHIREGGLEHEHGKLVWSFDISRPGTAGVTEVRVDANTGAIFSVTHESTADGLHAFRASFKRYKRYAHQHPGFQGNEPLPAIRAVRDSHPFPAAAPDRADAHSSVSVPE
jgi:hypothetical protein